MVKGIKKAATRSNLDRGRKLDKIWGIFIRNYFYA